MRYTNSITLHYTSHLPKTRVWRPVYETELDHFYQKFQEQCREPTLDWILHICENKYEVNEVKKTVLYSKTSAMAILWLQWDSNK